ncbi:MAG: dTMP kinase [Armatimonadota bacterium]
MHSGFFITIEGIEGSGKSTLAAHLAGQLARQGGEVVVTAEPGGDPVAEQIRRFLLHSADAISDRAELLLFEAARAQHVEKTILPALKRGAVVICDRFTDSSLAYQGLARGLGLEVVTELNEFATGGLRPDLTILLDLPAEVGLSRTRSKDRFSSEGIEFHNAVREGYLAIAAREPDRFVIIDAGRPVDEVVRQAAKAAEARRGRDG